MQATTTLLTIMMMVMTAIAVGLTILYPRFRVKVKILKKWTMTMIQPLVVTKLIKYQS